MGVSCCLSLGACTTSATTTSRLPAATAACKIGTLPDVLGRPDTLLADNGYFSEANVQACVAGGIEPLIALGREAHHPSLQEPSAAPCSLRGKLHRRASAADRPKWR